MNESSQELTRSFHPSRLDSLVEDYRLAVRSREASLLGRREVLTGKAKFGIFGDGKELAQIALAKQVRPGDFRSGYYRDQTWMLALGAITLQQFFAQLYADSDPVREPWSGGRQMTAHFATELVDQHGEFVRQTDRFNSSADQSPTGSQMPRLVGLAQASKVYREFPNLDPEGKFSRFGNEVAFGSIGNASCAEGVFWESVNAIGVLEVPAVISIWDDGYGISVPNEYQLTKSNLSEIIAGFAKGEKGSGYNIFRVPGWDYDRLLEVYGEAVHDARVGHVPALVHVVELTQPQGHSTSGSHERYKSAERLEWEHQADCLPHLRRLILDRGLVTDGELQRMEEEDRDAVRSAQRAAWESFQGELDRERSELLPLLAGLVVPQPNQPIQDLIAGLERKQVVIRKDLAQAAVSALALTASSGTDSVTSGGEEVLVARQALLSWRERHHDENLARYADHLYCESESSPLRVPVVEPTYDADSPLVKGFEVLSGFFDAVLERDPRVLAFGEDVGKLGDVNQGMAGLQEKYGVGRVSDVGIREATILGQAIGLAMRGLRPIAEVQYLDYVLYALQIMSDDLATLRWRTRGKQMAPVIVRTRGHRLEGIWHSGSPMGGLVHFLRGMVVCVPRNMTQAAGMYNTLLQGDDPALVVEVLNAYRNKERIPNNLSEATVPLGVPEILRSGSDVTVVTYGACCPIVLDAAEHLAAMGVEAEVIDVRTLLPFDLHRVIGKSVERTNRVVFVDEDVPGGASAYMMQQVVERQQAFQWLDSPPKTISASSHRPAYGTDGDYFSKPNREDILLAIYNLVRDFAPEDYPPILDPISTGR